MEKLSNIDYCLFVHYRNPFLYNAGSEKYIINQISYFKNMMIDCLLLFPVSKGKWIKGWGIIINGIFEGIYSINKVIETINGYNASHYCRGIFVHSVIGADESELKSLITFGPTVNFYIHDYSTCCQQYNLIKNDVSFCGDARLYDEKCSNCKYYYHSVEKKKKLLALFITINKKRFIAPSELCAKLWTEAYPEFENDTIVLNHLRFEGEFIGNNMLIDRGETINIAFVGAGVLNKGWNKWMTLANKLKNNINYRLFHMGSAPKRFEWITNVDVAIKNKGGNAMVDALRKNNIAVALLLSECPETYSYTYYECYASNCYVVTTDVSGNIAFEVKNKKNGLVIDNNIETLVSLFSNPEIIRQNINNYRNSEHYTPLKLIPNDMHSQFLSYGHSTSIIQNVRSKSIYGAIICNFLYRIRYFHFFRCFFDRKV